MSKVRPCIPWTIDDVHEVYGKVVKFRSIDGEAYRWFEKDGVIKKVPLSLLLDRELTDDDRLCK